MLLSMKLKHLLIILIFTSILAEITGNKQKAAAKKKKNTDRKNKEKEGICPTPKVFYQQEIFKEVSEQFFKSKEEKGLNPVKEKKKKWKKRTKIHNCDSLDYNAFLKYYYENNAKKPITLKCDLIKPKLSSVPDNNILCITFGQYLIQFGIKVFYNFIKYLLKIEKNSKKSFFSKMLNVKIQNLVKKFQKGTDKKKCKNTIKKLIDAFYKSNCNKIMPHYNAFYVFYNEYSTTLKDFIETPTCDYFKHIPRIEALNEINII